jgi:mycothiol synthase
MLELRHARLEDAGPVAGLLAKCAAADGRPALSEFKALRVPVANAVRTLVAEDAGGSIVAIGVVAWHPAEIGEAGGYWAAEAAIDPALRSLGRYHELLAALEGELGASPSFWAFDVVQGEAAHSWGMHEVRAIVEMHCRLPAAHAGFPDGVGVRGFQVGRDESGWLKLNHEVFAAHPEAGSIDWPDLALRMAQPWFDPKGFLILTAREQSIGYCWTKLHDEELGEIYMIGILPSYRGRGLARPLTAAGLDHLYRRGAQRAGLYAEATNATAIGLYESMGFEATRRVALYEK